MGVYKCKLGDSGTCSLSTKGARLDFEHFHMHRVNWFKAKMTHRLIFSVSRNETVLEKADGQPGTFRRLPAPSLS